MRHLFTASLFFALLAMKLPAETSIHDSEITDCQQSIIITKPKKEKFELAHMGQSNDSPIFFSATGAANFENIAVTMTSQTVTPKKFTSTSSTPNNFLPLITGTYLLTYDLSIFGPANHPFLITVILGGINDGIGGTSFTNTYSSFDSTSATLTVITGLTAKTPITLTAYVDDTSVSIESGATFSAALLSVP
jgi:hypothetical protein